AIVAFGGGLVLAWRQPFSWQVAYRERELPSRYAVVIDAGSTGSRVHVFRFALTSGELLDIGGTPEVFRSTIPGLSSCDRNHTCLSSLLEPLLQTAAASVPAELRPTTPLSVRATAGLRLLPHAQAEELLHDTRTVLQAYGFQDGGVELMGGDK
ncbi:unnamed protein product, partial [Polarella glacialis]